MKIRLFETQDAEKVLSWISSEREFRQWSANQYGNYPPNPGEIVLNYMLKISVEGFFPLIFEDKGKTIGHLTLRYPTDDESLVRLGFIIVDKKKRGKGYGCRMILDAMQFAVKNMGATRFDLGVFTNNEKAYKCYKRLGFEPTTLQESAYNFHGESWDIQNMVYDPKSKITKMVIDRIIKTESSIFS